MDEKVVVMGVRIGSSLDTSTDMEEIPTMEAKCHHCEYLVKITDFSLDMLSKNPKNEVMCMDCYLKQFNSYEEAGRNLLKHMHIPKEQLKELEQAGWFTDEKYLRKMIAHIFGFKEKSNE